MELTVSIKEQDKIATFLNLIKKINYVEIIDVKEDAGELPVEHRELLDIRLSKIEKNETTFKNWDTIAKKYENRSV
jgi:hypothetical protein